MRYVIRVKGHLDILWQAWFENLSITHESDGTTLLYGPIRDQAALYGILFNMKELAPTLHYDFQLVVDMSGKLESFRAVRPEVLLLGGSKSPTFLKVALDALEKVLPHVKRVELPGLNHAASWNTDRGGQPEPVAQELRRFFAEL